MMLTSKRFVPNHLNASYDTHPSPSTSLHAKTRNAKAIMDYESRIGANAQLRVLGSPRTANTPKRRDIESPQ